MVIKAFIMKDDVSLDGLLKELAPRASRMGCGAFVSFVGFVKGVVGKEEVTELRYESYEELAEKKLREIAEETAEKFGAHDVVIIHRVGVLKPGETTIYIAVTAPSRKAAFDAASYALERVKHEVPIWKKEVTEKRSYWVENV